LILIHRECCEEQESSPKHKYTVPTTNLPSDEILDDEALMEYFNFDNFSDSCNKLQHFNICTVDEFNIIMFYRRH